MKKILSLVLALALMMTLPITAAAAEPYHTETDMAAAEYYADSLYALGLLKGTGNGYELSRPFKRIEALVMLIRLLGKEEEALSGDYPNPFEDMAGSNWSWAWPYVGYAYATDLTKGVGHDKFDPEVLATPQMYVTYILRALDYTDADAPSGDLYTDALTVADSIPNLLSNTSDPYNLCLEPDQFWRADAVDLAFRALKENDVVKGGGSLFDKLDAEGLFDAKPAKDPIGIHHARINVRNYGTVTLELDGDTAPITVANFMKLAQEGFYDGLTFHRIMNGFMIQGGDPKGDGTGGSDTKIRGEFSENGIANGISHVKGTISMARANNNYDSASSQFFITVGDATWLDGYYAAFGRVTSGQDVVDKIAADAQPIDDNGTIPADQQPVIESIAILD